VRSTENRLTRNRGFISFSQQNKLAKSRVSIAGVGGVGGRLAIELARLGVGAIRLADPDVFTVTNLNRQEGSFTSTLGRLKVEVIGDMCKDINPKINMEVFTEGVTETNLAHFCTDADLIVEATDFTLPHIGVMLAREARRRRLPVVMGIELGFGATVAWFKPDGYTYERYLGLSSSTSLNELKNGKIKINIGRWLPRLPSYGDLNVLKAVSNGAIEAPAIAPAVDICAALSATLILGLLAGYHVQPPAPSVFVFDAKEGKSRLVRYPRMSYKLTLVRLVAKNIVGKHDPMSIP
jgi:molybdopterin/thiamine biosynthesis adenylyltransferase